jgi:hypothetical protein
MDMGERHKGKKVKRQIMKCDAKILFFLEPSKMGT